MNNFYNLFIFNTQHMIKSSKNTQLTHIMFIFLLTSLFQKIDSSTLGFLEEIIRKCSLVAALLLRQHPHSVNRIENLQTLKY